MKQLETGKKYTNIESLFARCFLVAGSSHKKNVLVFPHEKVLLRAKKFLDILLPRPVSIIDSPDIYFQSCWEDSGCFLVTSDIVYRSGIRDYHKTTFIREIKKGQSCDISDFLTWLSDNGYEGNNTQESGTYFRQADQLKIHTHNTSIDVSFFGDQIDELYINSDPVTSVKVLSLKLPEEVDIYQESSDTDTQSLGDLCACTWYMGLDFDENRKLFMDAGHDWIALMDLLTDDAIPLDFSAIHIQSIQQLASILSEHDSVEVYTRNTKIFQSFSEENGFTNISIYHTSNTICESFVYTDSSKQKKLILSDDIVSHIFVKKRSKKQNQLSTDLLLKIQKGDYVVHIYHGIGRYAGNITKDLSGVKREYLQIEYAGEDKLFVPIEEVYRVSKYVGDDPTLTKLGKPEWKKTLASTQREIEDIADSLLENHAKRQISRATPLYAFNEEKIFSEAFGFTHTPDQVSAIDDILTDLSKDIPMDRLLSGDVGFGKTEVAMHAIYRSFLNKKQTLLVTPLVVLAYEHFDSCKKRFASFGINVAILTRLSTYSETKEVLQELKQGSIDVLIGTHRLLSEDIECSDLGLLVLDEEHKFGVKDKERVQAIQSNLHTLTMSATPIPRSLNLALSGVKKISLLTTPPFGKKPIPTVVTGFNPDIISAAFASEIQRNGKMFFIHNRVESIESIATQLGNICGEKARIGIVHGQMTGTMMEDRILDFKSGKYNILLSTTVIENGINFIDTNTIIINNADQFGLAQLHQLRGRVGRGQTEGKAYLLYGRNDLPEDSKKRLVTIANHTHLGAGFEIAMKDMEIRGAGDVLGIKQSGKTKEIGVNLYLKLLEQKIQELQSGKKKVPECRIDIGMSYFIPDSFFDSDMDEIEEVQYAYEQLTTEHEDIPEQVITFFLLLESKLFLQKYGVIELKKSLGNYVFTFDSGVSQEQMRSFLDIDAHKHIVLISMTKAQIPVRDFQGPSTMLKYLVR